MLLIKNIKKGVLGMHVLLILMLSIFLSSLVFAENEDLYSYQKLKNITRGDDPAGAITTVGFKGDRVHYLIFIHNKGLAEKTYNITTHLPQFLEYIPSSAQYYKYQQGEWRNLKNNQSFPLHSYQETLQANEWIYYTYRVDIDSLPPSNVALSNIVKIEDLEGNTLKQTVTKILAPNQQLLQFNNEESDILKKELTKYEQRLLDDEFVFIENAFKKAQEEDLLALEDRIVHTDKSIWWGTFIGSLLLFTLILYHAYVKKII